MRSDRLHSRLTSGVHWRHRYVLQPIPICHLAGLAMCGRFNVTSDPLSQLLMELVGLPHPGPEDLNLAPTQSCAVLRMDSAGEPELAEMRWWLTPYWTKEPSTKYSMFNAKSETAAKSPAFREPYRKRRCVVPISGFYEWAKHSQDGKVSKVPYYIKPSATDGLLLAGLWDRWKNPESDEVLESFTVLTTQAHPAMNFVHHRQPVMLSPEDALAWLDPTKATEDMQEFFSSLLPMELDAIPVSTHVNNARNKDQRVIAPVGDTVTIDDTFV